MTWVTDDELELFGVEPDEIERLRDADCDKRRKVIDRELRALMSAPSGR